jgi:acyl-CoA reductase-like NAD-dependent aldehyde dehydrogenase
MAKHRTHSVEFKRQVYTWEMFRRIDARRPGTFENCYQAMDPAVPFGGYKMSGYGRESGKQHVEEYLNVKAVWIKTG